MPKKKYSKQAYFGKDASGKQIRKRFYADKKTDLDKMIDQYKDELKKVPNPSDVTFEEYSELWFATYKSNLATQTQATCRNHLKKCASLNPYQIRKITRTMCQGIVNASWEHPHAAKGVSDVLRQIFRAALQDGIIAASPAESLSRPKMSKPKFHLLTDKELEAVKNAKLSDQDRLFVVILQAFGLRPGEALALRPDDFNLKEKVLHITKALEMPSSGCRIKATKTGVSRDIPVPDTLIPYLKKAVTQTGGFYLFTKRDGQLYTKSAYKRLSERIWKAVNVELGGNEFLCMVSDCTLYDFRHRRATDLYYLTQRGIISSKKAAALMGHSEIVFLNTYSHIDEKMENCEGIYPNSEQLVNS